MSSDPIHLSVPHLTDRELAYVKQAIESNWIAPLGPMVDSFEKAFSEYTGIPHCLALNSGTSAIHLALRGVGVGAGDSVFASTLTFIGGVAPILYQQATPVFIDSDEKSWCIDVDLLAQALADAKKKGKLPKAVLPTDIYGQSCDAAAIEKLCNEYGVALVVDSAESVGATYGKKHVGHHGNAAAFSFNGNKIITASGGGMLASHDKKLIDHARFLSTQARDDAPHYQHTTFGYNYRLSNIMAGIGRGQLEVLPERVKRRREVFAAYKKLLGDVPGIRFMPEAPYGQGTHWLTVITIDPKAFGAHRDDVIKALRADNIEARPTWKPMHMQPVFKDAKAIGGKVSEKIFEQGMCLPSSSNLTDAQIERVTNVIKGTKRAS